MRLCGFFVTATLALAQGQLFSRLATHAEGDTITYTLSPLRISNHSKIAAPYSADQILEHVQTLANGTKIRQPTTVQRVFRDSDGRTRMERPYSLRPGDPTPMLVEIFDPVAGFSYVLDTQNKIAHRTGLQSSPFRGVGAIGKNAGRPSPRNQAEDLGDQSMEGLAVHGIRSTTIWPAEFEGNDAPLTDVTEMWVSRDLGVTVFNRFTSARSGESTMKLTNISRSEPDRTLFAPPADFRIVDEPDSFKVTMKRLALSPRM